MIWIVLVGLTAVAAFIVLRPLLHGGQEEAAGASSLSVYREQLKEIDADIVRGMIAEGEAEAARIEIKRRILNLNSEHAASPSPGISVQVAAIVGGVFCAFTLSIYLLLGRPSLPGHTYSAAAEQQTEVTQLTDEVGGMIAKLQAHLKTHPKDIEGWRALGWAQLQIGKAQAGVEALKRASDLAPSDVSILSMLGEALVRQSEGDVKDEALAVFERVLALNPKDARARFYKGLAFTQSGQEKAGLDLWISIIRDGPADAEWIPGVRQQALMLVEKLKLDPAIVPAAKTLPGP